MINNVNHWFSKYRRGLGLVLFLFACASVGRPQDRTAQTVQSVKILGFNPKEVDLGQSVQMRVSSKLREGYSVLVEDIPAKTTTSSDPLWVEIDIPSSLPPADSVKVTLIDGGYSTSASLRIKPIQILNVNPSQAQSSERITFSIHPSGVSIPSNSRLIFAPPDFQLPAKNFNGLPSSPVQVRSSLSGDEVSAVVPDPVSTGQVSLILLANDRASAPYYGFSVRGVSTASTANNGAGVGGSSSWNVVWLVLAIAATTLTIFLLVIRWRSSRQSKASVAPEPMVIPQEAALDVPALEVPPDLVEACLRGQCFLYAGAGLSARASLPTWPIFIEGLLKWAETATLIDPTFARSLEQALKHSGSLDRVADSVVSAVLDKGGRDSLQLYLNETFGKSLSLPDVHRLLPDLKLAAVLTTNFDELLEQAFKASNRNLPVYVPSDIDQLQASFSARQFFILKLYGTLRQPDSLLIAPAQYLERIRSDRPFSDFVQQVFHSRTLLFLGSSFAGIEAYLAPLKIRRGSQIRHYAIVAVNDASWRADADALERRYGIRVLPYVASARYSELLNFVRELREKVANADTTADSVTEDTEQAAVVLTGLELDNIGPFEHLELSFTRRWTVLLGDNGVGKSSILRAIAAAVAGDQAGAAGARLLRSGQTEGHIQVTTKSGERYASRVFLNSLKRPDISSEGASGLGGSTLVLAFPAIRTMAAGSARSRDLRDLRKPPTADDVLPALGAMPDPRILGFKQWLVDLDYTKTKNPELAERVNKVLDALTNALGILLGGMKLERIEVVEKDVFVETEDGRLSLDSLSQGTISILGWVGVLVQRLHEVSEKADGRALVLLDEIDAHMHPEWQQAIIARLVQVFPLVQFIVSTHSPFLAVGRRAQEIIRFKRDAFSKKVVAEVADRDTTDMTVADVLTSYLFGLQTAVDHDLQKDVLRLRELSLTPSLSAKELDELKDLQTKLDNVGIADTQADPLYGRFVAELRKQRSAEITKLPPLSKKAEERQRELTKQMAQKVLGDVRSIERK